MELFGSDCEFLIQLDASQSQAWPPIIPRAHVCVHPDEFENPEDAYADILSDAANVPKGYKLIDAADTADDQFYLEVRCRDAYGTTSRSLTSAWSREP